MMRHRAVRAVPDVMIVGERLAAFGCPVFRRNDPGPDHHRSSTLVGWIVWKERVT
jgi:hypothetical protein